MHSSCPDRLVVGVPVRNQLPFVRACLESLARHRSPDVRILLVDDASQSACREYLCDYAARIEGVNLVRNGRQRGFPYNCNEIVYNSSEETVCFLNSDTLVSAGWHKYLLEVMGADKSFQISGPSTCFTHTPQALPGLLESRMHQNEETVAALSRAVYRQYRGMYKVLSPLGGFCFMVRRALFEQIGYFDERFGLGAGEEDDFMHRADRAGVRPVWVKYAYVHHFGHISFTEELGAASRELWTRNRLIRDIKRMTPDLGEIVHPRSSPAWRH